MHVYTLIIFAQTENICVIIIVHFMRHKLRSEDCQWREKEGRVNVYLAVKLTSSLCRQMISMRPVRISAMHFR